MLSPSEAIRHFNCPYKCLCYYGLMLLRSSRIKLIPDLDDTQKGSRSLRMFNLIQCKDESSNQALYAGSETSCSSGDLSFSNQACV